MEEMEMKRRQTKVTTRQRMALRKMTTKEVQATRREMKEELRKTRSSQMGQTFSAWQFFFQHDFDKMFLKLDSCMRISVIQISLRLLLILLS